MSIMSMIIIVCEAVIIREYQANDIICLLSLINTRQVLSGVQASWWKDFLIKSI